VSQDVCKPRGGSGKVPGTREEARQEAWRCLATLECRFCNVCELLCPDLCITRDPKTGHILIDLNHCKGCGLCAHYCPKGAIHMELEPAG
jgi:2-oxoacid:acceptor oxidoreductase delta subunit (pyruvate/2-ketoisovalerate family)